MKRRFAAPNIPNNFQKDKGKDRQREKNIDRESQTDKERETERGYLADKQCLMFGHQHSKDLLTIAKINKEKKIKLRKVNSGEKSFLQRTK